MKINFPNNQFYNSLYSKTVSSSKAGLNFGKYKNSKYMEKSYTTNSLLDYNTKPDNLDNVDIQDEDATLEYSTKRLEAIYAHFGLFLPEFTQEAKDKVRCQLNDTLQRLSGGGLDASNLDMLTRLVEDKKLALSVLAPLKNGYQISRNVSDDLDRLYDAYTEKKDIKAIFVPEFESEDEALLLLGTGDVCKIKGDDNISIKVSDDSIQKLFITPDTYLELFPPVERFITTQQEVGDCYLLSAINSINNNPASCHKLLEMFRENPDNTVDVVFGGFEERCGKILPKNPENAVLCDIASKIPKHRNDYAATTTCEGFRAIEALNEFERQNFANWCVERKYKEFKEKGTNAGYCSLRPYTEEEIEYFIKYVDKNGPDEMFCLQNNHAMDIFTLPRGEVEQRLEELKGEEDDNSKYKALMLQRWLKSMDRTGAPAYDIFGEDVPKEFIVDLFKNVSSADLYLNNGGSTTDIFEKFGFDVILDHKYVFEAEKELFDSNPNKYVFTASTSKYIDESVKEKFIKSHAYSLECVDIEGERKFAIRDPQNSVEEIILSYDELRKYFSTITIAKI